MALRRRRSHRRSGPAGVLAEALGGPRAGNLDTESALPQPAKPRRRSSRRCSGAAAPPRRPRCPLHRRCPRILASAPRAGAKHA
eukprot:15474763-Alexandrium_andersonii.AAC.1